MAKYKVGFEFDRYWIDVDADSEDEAIKEAEIQLEDISAYVLSIFSTDVEKID